MILSGFYTPLRFLLRFLLSWHIDQRKRKTLKPLGLKGFEWSC